MQFIVTLLLSILLAGCQTIRPIDRPQVDDGGQWRSVPPGQGKALQEDWWRLYQSAGLDQLVERGLANNQDVQVAFETMRQAAWQRDSAAAGRWPTLTLSGGSSIDSRHSAGSGWQDSESSRLSLAAGYELDLWGRVAASIAAADASLVASRYDLDSLRISLAAEIAGNWFDWLALQQRLQIAEKNLQLVERLSRVVEARYRHGAASAADLARQQTVLHSQRAALLPLQLQLRQRAAALAVLQGLAPWQQDWPQESLMAVVPVVADSGLPVDLLARRPDLAALEARLAAADADVAVARTALLPSVQLGAVLARASDGLLFAGSATDSAGISSSLLQSVFSAGRLSSQVRISESRQRALLAQYHKAIHQALLEVDDALDSLRISEQQEQQQQAIVAEAERAMQLTEARYRAGQDDVSALLDAQRSLLQAEDQLVQQRLQRLNASVSLVRALGGGWQAGSDNADNGL